MADACSLCPNYITAAVQKPVEEALGQVRSVKRRAQSVNAALKGIVGSAVADIAGVVSLIPIPPILDIPEIISIIACPLTPLALALDATLIANLDPRELYGLVQKQIVQFTKDVIKNYEEGLKLLGSFKVVGIAKRFLEDLLRINLDAVLLAEATAIAVFVQATCPEEFEDGPYQAFLDEITDFSLDGVVPSTLDSDVSGVLTQLQVGDTQISAWKTLGSAPVPF